MFRPAEVVVVVEVVVVEPVSSALNRNVLILGVTESKSNLTVENDRKDEEHKMDKDKVEIIMDTIDVNKSNVVAIVRFKPKAPSNRPPAILIRFSEEIHRISTLMAAKKLVGASAYKYIYINADLTEKERIQEREIREQKKALLENLRMDSLE